MNQTVRALFHRLWTKAVGTPDYEKSEWRTLDGLLGIDAPTGLGASLPDDIRAAGWVVAVHNDYVLQGERNTFWLFTHHDGRWVKGEGKTDADALNQIRSTLHLPR